MEFLSVSATILGLIGIAGGAAGYFKASRGDSIIKYQATEISLRDGSITNLKTDLATVTESCAAKDQTIVELKKHNAYLQKLPQGGAQLKKLAEVVERQASTMEKLAKEVKGLVSREGRK